MNERREWTVEEFQKRVEDALVLAFKGLTTDGAHHKQWYLEQIVRELGLSPEEFTARTGRTWEPGIAP